MKNKLQNLTLTLALLACATLNSQPSTARAQGTAFTYQGQLQSNGSPANGSYDVMFTLYNSNNAGAIMAGPVTELGTPVTNGLFTILIDFGPEMFTGGSNWLQIAVRTNGAVLFNTLTPRQQVTPTPYAIFAGTASNVVGTISAAQLSGAVPTASLSGSYVNPVTLINAANNFSGNGAGLTGVNAASLNGFTSTGFWKTNGNAGANPTNGSFLGTTDNLPLELRVNGARAFRLEPTANGQANLIGGSSNSVVGGAVGATIAGGTQNIVNTNFSGNNLYSSYGSIGGGLENSSSGNLSVISGGSNNTNDGWYSAIGGGDHNYLQANAAYSVIAGGEVNTVLNSADYSAIGGGWGDTILASSYVGTIAGGWNNTNAGFVGTIGGGNANYIMAAGNYATIPGGASNTASGSFSFAAGQEAQALHQGAFVWADSQDAPFASTTKDSFNVRARGGVKLVTSGAGLTVDGQLLTGTTAAAPPANAYPILNMVWIVPGTFLMGAPTSEPDYYSDETQHLVTLTNGFWMGQHPVTQGEYQGVMGSNPSSFTGDLTRPVETVTWLNATNFCSVLTQREQSAGRLPAGWAYRLPTEAEWEYCCRALTTSRFYFGNDPGDSASLTNDAWYSVNSASSTQPVGQLSPNAWGLADMAGNVWEWCQDWYGTYPAGNISYNPQGVATGTSRVSRGGSYVNLAANCRSAARNSTGPTSAGSNIGFRVVLAPGQ